MSDERFDDAKLDEIVSILDEGENFYAESSLWYDSKLAAAADNASEAIRQLRQERDRLKRECDRVIREKACGQWIDVKALKPKVGEMVFFLGPQGLDTARWYGIVCESGNLVMLQSWTSPGFSATHWMPIPELPESP